MDFSEPIVSNSILRNISLDSCNALDGWLYASRDGSFSDGPWVYVSVAYEHLETGFIEGDKILLRGANYDRLKELTNDFKDLELRFANLYFYSGALVGLEIQMD